MPDFMGYRIEATGNDKSPYILHGPRGACYGLLRNLSRPEHLFAVNIGKLHIGPVIVKGYGWFTDAGGELRPLRPQ